MKILINATLSDAGFQWLKEIEDSVVTYQDRFADEQMTVLVREIHSSSFPSFFLPVKLPALPIAGKLFLKNKIVQIIRELRPDVIISFSSAYFAIHTPQIFYASRFVQQHANGLTEKTVKKISDRLKSFNCIVVNSLKEKDFFLKYFPETKEKIRLIYRITAGFGRPPEYDEKQSVKERFTHGSEYFLLPPIDREDLLVNVLKAFTGFKKWQKSGMKLVITERADNKEEIDTERLLHNYRLRDEVVVISSDDTEYDKVFSASYAIILPEKLNTDFLYLISALEANTAILLPDESVFAEVMRDGVFRFQHQNKDDLTRAMLEVFRDESERSARIKIAGSILSELRQNDFYDNLKKLFFDISGAEKIV